MHSLQTFLYGAEFRGIGAVKNDVESLVGKFEGESTTKPRPRASDENPRLFLSRTFTGFKMKIALDA